MSKRSQNVHGEKLIATMQSKKLPPNDYKRLEKALLKYELWTKALKNADLTLSLENLIKYMLDLLNSYKLFIDLELIFDSPNDFLYRQKGQLKLDNTVIEEFLPLFVQKCIEKVLGNSDLTITAQAQIFSSLSFNSSIANPAKGGGIIIKSKDQDFSMSRPLFLKSSHSPHFKEDESITIATQLGYVLAELKTNLDKTMFQEACATAHEVKQAVTGAKYFLLCDFLDMTPISSSTTDIDEILLLRKAKRLAPHIRAHFNTFSGRQSHRELYMNYLQNNPYSVDILTRFIEYIFSFLSNKELLEKSVLENGYF